MHTQLYTCSYIHTYTYTYTYAQTYAHIRIHLEARQHGILERQDEHPCVIPGLCLCKRQNRNRHVSRDKELKRCSSMQAGNAACQRVEDSLLASVSDRHSLEQLCKKGVTSWESSLKEFSSDKVQKTWLGATDEVPRIEADRGQVVK